MLVTIWPPSVKHSPTALMLAVQDGCKCREWCPIRQLRPGRGGPNAVDTTGVAVTDQIGSKEGRGASGLEILLGIAAPVPRLSASFCL